MPRVPEELVKLNPEFFSEMTFDYECNRILKCIPFVGAGMSVDFGLPTWVEFIKELAEQQGNRDIVSLLDENEDQEDFNLEEAASKVYRNPIAFASYAKPRFNINITDDQIDNSSVKILPKLFQKSAIITTNYDNVLSQVYARNNLHRQVINYTEFENVDAAMFNNGNCIIKLHGSFDMGGHYIFTKEQYDKVYNDVRFKDELSIVLRSRPLLFLGCSLIRERFLETWKNLANRNEDFYHYAILSAKKDEEEQRKYEEQIIQHHIYPIWYPAERHEYVGYILKLIGIQAGRLTHNYPPVPHNHSFMERIDENSTNQILARIYGDRNKNTVSINEESIHSKFIYITGLGGIGKTTLMRQLYHKIKKEMDEAIPDDSHIVYMEFKDDWVTTLKTRDIHIKDNREKYILFIDNLPIDWYEQEDLSFNTFAAQCQIFVTSRCSIDEQTLSDYADFSEEVYYINLGWKFPNAEELFVRYFDWNRHDYWKGKEIISDFVKMSGNHTLTIEILANHARMRVKGNEGDRDKSTEILIQFKKELENNNFDLSEITDLKNLVSIYKRITKHLKTLVNLDEMTVGEKYVMQIFSLLADSPFHPKHIGYKLQSDCMEKLMNLGWIKEIEEDAYIVHEIVKKLVFDKEKDNSLEYLDIRDLVFCIGKALAKRTIEKKGGNVFKEIDTINHAQSLYDYLNRILPQGKYNLLDYSNPVNDNDYVEMVNNLFSSYDDIDLRNKAFIGSEEAEILSRNTHDYALYSYAVSANSIGYLCAHSRNGNLPDERHLERAFVYLNDAKDALDKTFNPNNKEVLILKGKILSNLGAYYNARLKVDIELKKQNRKEPEDKELEKRISIDFNEALRYHKASLELRERLFLQYQDKDICDHIFTSKENIANDYYQVGNLVGAVEYRLSFLPDLEKYYGEQEHIKKFVTLRNLGDTCKDIVLALNRGQFLENFDKGQLEKYKEMAILYLEQAKAIREKIDNHEEIVKKICESLETVRSTM